MHHAPLPLRAPTAAFMSGFTPPPNGRVRPARSLPARSLMVTAVGLALLLAAASGSPAFAAKRKARPAIPPELRIVSVIMAPESYTAGTGMLDFIIEVELPKEVDRNVLLEVSSLISSPSRRSMRFLSSRQPVEQTPASILTTPATGESKRRLEVTLSWDGMDQSKQVVHGGEYKYEVKAKLLTVGESGARTHMVSWPKRGTLMVK